MIPILLSGCSDANTQISPQVQESTGSVSVTTKAVQDSTETITVSPRDIPLLSIETVDKSADVMDFVTKPVNDYVAKSIASWTPGYKMPPEPYYEACTVTLTDTDGIVSVNAAEADVKVRGNWTTNYSKKPLRIKFSEKQNLLGLNDGAEMKNWVLLAEYKDTSMLRNKTALAISREILGADGLYAADSTLVEVEINGEYWGVYLLTEQQQVNPDRVNIYEPEKDYEAVDIGYFMEFDGYFFNEDDLHQFRVDYADNAPLIPFDGNGGSGRTMSPLNTGHGDRTQDVGITIKSNIYSQYQHDFIASYINNIYRIMYEAAYNDKAYKFHWEYPELEESDSTPQHAVEIAVDVDSLADMYIISELTCDADIYWSSFFMDINMGRGGSELREDVHEIGLLTFEAPWDFDSAMGNKDRCADGKGFYAANIVYDVNDQYETINPWLAVLMYEDWFQDIIREKWTSAYDSGVFDRAYEMIENDTAQYHDAFERNYQRWDNLLHNEAAGEWSKRSAQCKTHEESAAYLEEWLRTRVEFLNDHWHK
ncbi:MAG: CotH kinase family protein [Oscillospiraceae bacterium]|nr:CotH kinase family protein [Oscillospiraceae bacterium]